MSNLRLTGKEEEKFLSRDKKMTIKESVRKDSKEEEYKRWKKKYESSLSKWSKTK